MKACGAKHEGPDVGTLNYVSVLRWFLLDFLDDDVQYAALLRFQLQAELLNGGEYRRRVWR